MLSQVAELDTEGRLRKSANPRIMLEALLLRFAHLSNTVDLENLLRGEPAGPRPDEDTQKPSVAPARPQTHSQSQSQTESRSQSQAPPEPEPPTHAADATTAWKDLLSSRSGLPQGLIIFLKVARVSEAQTGTVVLELPKAGYEHLSGDAGARNAIEKGLSEKLGRSVKLEVKTENAEAIPVSDAPRRLTPELVKSEKLARLAKEDPMLGKAVEEWNLELLD